MMMSHITSALGDTLKENTHVFIVIYAGKAGLFKSVVIKTAVMENYNY